MNSNNKLEVKDPKDIQVLNLIEGDIGLAKPKEKEYIEIAGRQQVLNQYGDFKLREQESKSYHDWDKDNERICRDAENFMRDSMDTPGQTYSGRNKIPYGFESLSDGGFNIIPLPDEQEVKEKNLKLI